MTRWGFVVAIASVLVGGCKKKEPPPPPLVEAMPDAAPPPPPPDVARPLPAGTGDGLIGVAGKEHELVRAADDGSWVVVCEPQSLQHLRVVVGDGPGIMADSLMAASDRDLLIVDGSSLIHVDVAAKTQLRLGPAAIATVDADSRRIVLADGKKLVIRDPGVAPRTIDTGAPIAALFQDQQRWIGVVAGSPPSVTGAPCGVQDFAAYAQATRRMIDLDPTGVEAMERRTPELAVTSTGEITLDGETVVAPECEGTVRAALADPPRAYVMCKKGHNHVVGPGGFDKEVGGYGQPDTDGATIADNLMLGERIVCVSGACIDLVSGRDYDTFGKPVVWSNRKVLVRADGSAKLLVDDLDGDGHREVVLPRVTRAIKVDTVTGRRIAGAAPTLPAFVDGAGDMLLYGRYVVDVAAGTLVSTLAVDAVAVDRTGRVLVPTGDARRLRWLRNR